ncbi:CDP-glucose 4,6-dehydratase [Candidatus Entotheonella serta]|nr:CDP-glucose 4,6-dehydratase [Candidatus Entotheonella serta]
MGDIQWGSQSMLLNDVYNDKTVCITGHTGFKGAWLSEWLLGLGAHVVGYALAPPTAPSLFNELQLSSRLAADRRGDVRFLPDVQAMLRDYRPDFIFHLAAQSLVRPAFDRPHEAFETNVMGSLNMLEAVRRENHPCVVIMVTSDKVYRNIAWLHAYREPDGLGGHDPYSASKVCAELLTDSYRQSFFQVPPLATAPAIAVAIARGSNVIGGGDWAVDRLVPDCVRHLARQRPIPVRHRHATRPWQHVLDLLSGYLTLGARLFRACDRTQPNGAEQLPELCSAFNFGPSTEAHRSVASLVQAILQHWPGTWEDVSQAQANGKPEADILHLAINKAYHTLGWQPCWSFATAVQATVSWYRNYYDTTAPTPGFMQDLTQSQIAAYTAVYEANQALSPGA